MNTINDKPAATAPRIFTADEVTQITDGIKRQRDAWQDLFRQVAKALQCLPSLFANDNDHVIKAAEAATVAAAAQPDTEVDLAPSRLGRVYLAGPMTGYPGHNFDAFNAAAKHLRANGSHVENPAEHGIVEGAQWADYMRYDLERLATCEDIALLPGWSKSKGATLELHIAQALGMGVTYLYGAERPAEEAAIDRPFAYEQVIVDGKGRELQRRLVYAQEVGALEDYVDEVSFAPLFKRIATQATLDPDMDQPDTTMAVSLADVDASIQQAEQMNQNMAKYGTIDAPESAQPDPAVAVTYRLEEKGKCYWCDWPQYAITAAEGDPACVALVYTKADADHIMTVLSTPPGEHLPWMADIYRLEDQGEHAYPRYAIIFSGEDPTCVARVFTKADADHIIALLTAHPAGQAVAQPGEV